MSNKIYMVYGKLKTQKRFMPFNMKENKFEVNLIHASMFFENDLGKLKKEIEYMNEYNKEYVFEIRVKK